MMLHKIHKKPTYINLHLSKDNFKIQKHPLNTYQHIKKYVQQQTNKAFFKLSNINKSIVK